MISRLKSFFRINRNHEIPLYFWFFFLCFTCYGILIPFFGFYWDAIPYLFHFNSFGAAGFPEFLASDRPFSAWIFMLTTSLFKFNPLGYHLVAFFLRFFCVIVFYHILKEIWSEKKNFILFSSSIFAVYPGFLQQPIAYLYCHHFSAFALFLLSIFLMIKAVRAEKNNCILYCLSLLTTSHFFIIEYFAFLELIRPFVLWYFLKNQSKEEKTNWQKLLLLWLPYALFFLVFLVWRVFIFKFPSYRPVFFEEVMLDPVQSITNLLERIPKDFYVTSVGAWAKTFSISQISAFGRSASMLFWTLTIVTFIITCLFTFFRSNNNNFPQKKEKSNISIFFCGILLFIFAGALVWVLGFPLDIAFSWDRLTLAFIPAVAILFGALLNLPRNAKILPNIFFVFLITSAVGSHFMNGMQFKYDWEDFKDFQKQLLWRIPSLEKNTALVTDELTLKYFSDNSLTAAFNWVYSKDIQNYQLPYVIIFTKARLGGSLTSLDPGTRIFQKYRTNFFEGSTNQLILFYHLPPGCVHITDPDLDILNPLIPKEIRPYVSLSRPDLINNNEDTNSVFFVDDHSIDTSWCFYYQKASLAVQNHNWQEAVRLGDLAFEGNDYPNDASERLPFIEAYAMHGDWEKAINYSNQTIEISELYRPIVCRLWERINSTYNNDVNGGAVEPKEYLSSNCIFNN